MSQTDADVPLDDAPPKSESQRPGLDSELEEGLRHLGNVLGGVATRLLGPGVTGRGLNDRPTISPAADEMIDDVGDNLGRLLHAAGRALEAHPTAPGAAFGAATRDAASPIEPAPGEAPLTEGLRALGRGLAATSEAVLDKVAPRRATGAEE
ncbi:MAG: hypothetical protein VX265_18140 [Myxococcota bacterium]|nr:hypothetical protein [Myxococcota bacterium]MEC8425619.1 hypothetical protein [Myxococcota bacterium]